MRSNFILPFNNLTKITTCPALEWVHLGHESEFGTVMVQVKADEAVIAAMKADPAYQWLEDIEDAEAI
jgi:hypothetical protein